MSRGRKPTNTSKGRDWEGTFKASVGYYLQAIIVELASLSVSRNGSEPPVRLKPKNALPTIQEAEKPFPVPDTWNWCRLGELCNYGTSSKAEPKNLNDSTWVLDLEDIEKESSVLLAKIRFADRASLSTKSVFKKGDVLYSKLRPYLDKVIVADEDGVCTTEILPLSVPDEINPHFLLLTLRLRSFLGYVNGVTKGMKMPRLGTKEGKMALVPIPSLEEQDRILRFLTDLESNSLKTEPYFNGTVERKILSLQHSQLKGSEISTELDGQLALVKELRQAYLREAMQGKLVPQDPSDEPAEKSLLEIAERRSELLGRDYPNRDEARTQQRKQNAHTIPQKLPSLPSGWAWTTLIQSCLLVVDCHNKTAPYVTKGIRLLRTTNIRDGRLNLTDPKFVNEETYARWSSRCEPAPGDILITREAPMGEACIIPDGMKVCMGQRMMLARIVENTVVREYLLYSLMAPDLMDRVQSKPVGNMVKHLRVRGIETLLIPLPPLAEQKRIVTKLERLMKYCDELEASIRASKQHAETLLQVALKEALEPNGKVILGIDGRI